MISLTRFNRQVFLLNGLLVEQVEALPDTTITLVNGKKIVVLDDIDDVKLKLLQFYQTIGVIAAYKDHTTEG
nr:flagellar FlbD family protein [Bacillus alkalicellulosilyticus]